MKQLPTRFACLSLLLVSGLSVACGSDEPLFTMPEVEPDSGDGVVVSPTPSNVSPTPSNDVEPSPSVSPNPTGPATSNLAARCTSDTQCGSGMVCKTPAEDDFQGGGPGNGYCTVDCTASVDDSLCEEFEAGAVCVPTSETQAHCMPSCAEGVNPESKCQGRADVACDFVTYSDFGVSYCRPACGSDADCDGKRCHLGFGTCVDELEGQDPIGSACDPDAATNSCASSFCTRGATEGTRDTGFCTGMCTLGGIGCGETEEEPEEPGAPFCANVVGLYSGVGDLGLCFQRCDCDDHCLSPDYKCLTLPDAQAQGFGVSGICIEHDYDLTGADEGFVLGVECPPGPDGGSMGEAGSDAATDGGSDDGGSDAVDAMVDARVPDGATMSLEPDAMPADAASADAQ